MKKTLFRRIALRIVPLINRCMLAAVNNCQDIWHLGPDFPRRYFVGLSKASTFEVNVKGVGLVRMRRSSSDLTIIRHIFRERAYELKGFPQSAAITECYQSILKSGQTPLIIDAGANIGASAIWFAKAFPEAHIMAVEPDAENVELCRYNVKHFANIGVLEAGISGRSGRAQMKADFEGHAAQTVKSEQGDIQLFTVDEILRKGPKNSVLFLLKVDIEGFEMDLFSASLEWLVDVQAIIIEPHDWLFPGKRTSGPLQEAMAKHRFEMLISGENLIYVR